MNDEDRVVVIDGNTPIGMNDRRSKIVIKIFLVFLYLFLVSMAPHKPGSVSSDAEKSKLIRRSSVKLRKPSLRMKETGKGKKNTRV
jgi:hypothetical protein